MGGLSIPLAFVAGLLSILSPCVFSLIPVYLGYLSGAGMEGMGEAPSGTGVASQARGGGINWPVLTHALAFVVGFAFIFVIVIGLPTTLLSHWLQRYSDWIMRLGGLILIVFGLHTLRVVHIPLFVVSRRASWGGGLQPGYARSLLFGAAFASGWSPCIGPLLGMVMTMAFTEPARAIPFLLAYTLGMALPFLLAALLLSRLTSWLERYARHARTIELLSGGLMTAVGVFMLTGWFARLNEALIRLTPVQLIDHLTLSTFTRYLYFTL